MALPNLDFEPKALRWRPRLGAPSWEVPSQNYAFCAPKPVFFGPKLPSYQVKMDKRREVVTALHVRLHCPVIETPFWPTKSTICPRDAPKMAQIGQNCA